MAKKIKTDYQRVTTNFQTLRQFIEDLKTQMALDLPNVYSRLNQADQDQGQGFISDLFWSAFNLITTIETLQGKEVIAWILGAFIQDIHDNISNYPSLDKQMDKFTERFSETLRCIEDQIAPIISDPKSNWDKVFTYGQHSVKVSDFDTFDFEDFGLNVEDKTSAISEKTAAFDEFENIYLFKPTWDNGQLYAILLNKINEISYKQLPKSSQKEEDIIYKIINDS